MADSQDIKDLSSGDTDMARRDFRGAVLSDLDMSGRDFTGAHFERADLSRSNLARSVMTSAYVAQMNLSDTNLSEVTSNNTAFYAVNFRGAVLNDANFSSSHFTKCDFSGCDLRGADFSRTHLNQGTDFSDALVDEDTNFEGAHIFRPLARQEAFRFYIVERGILVRNKGINTPPVVQETGMPKLASTDQGHVEIEYTNDNGEVAIGSNEFRFVARWSKADSASIYLIANPPSVEEVAVSKPMKSLHDFSKDSLDSSGFSPRTRNIREGQFAILRNLTGYAAVLKIERVKSVSHRDPRNWLRFSYCIVPDPWLDNKTSKTTTAALPVTNSEISERYTDIQAANLDHASAVLRQVDVLRRSLVDLTGSAPQISRPIGIGHNMPPEDFPFKAEDVAQFNQALDLIASEVLSKSPDKKRIEEAKQQLIQVGDRKVSAWVAARMNTFADSFFAEAGKSLASWKLWIAAWALLTGQVQQLVEILANFTQALS